MQGEFVDGKYEGKGTFTSAAEGWRYEGEWQRGVKSGIGII